jgi:hypothetical protein
MAGGEKASQSPLLYTELTVSWNYTVEGGRNIGLKRKRWSDNVTAAEWHDGLVVECIKECT